MGGVWGCTTPRGTLYTRAQTTFHKESTRETLVRLTKGALLQTDLHSDARNLLKSTILLRSSAQILHEIHISPTKCYNFYRFHRDSQGIYTFPGQIYARNTCS